MSPSIYSYVLRSDTGFAPNPYCGFLTLATCKPLIRSRAQVGDWLLGTGSAATAGTGLAVYAGLISSVVTMEKYGAERKYSGKIPSVNAVGWRTNGDNIYFRNLRGEVEQRLNKNHDLMSMARDMSGKNVLLCAKFWYFGKCAVPLPGYLQCIVKKGPGYRRIQDAQRVSVFAGWLEGQPEGISGDPIDGTLD